MIALLIISYIVIGYLSVLLECYLDKRILSLGDAMTIMTIWPVLFLMIVVGFVCWVFGIWIPQLCAGKKRV